MGQKFYASPTDTFTHPNGAIAHRTGAGSFDALGPYAKVRNCPIAGTSLRLTCYATNYPDTAFSVPACTRYRGKYISGYFSRCDDGIEFRPMARHHEFLGIPIVELWKSPAGHGWFVIVNGLQNCDIPYSPTTVDADKLASDAYPGVRILWPHMPEHSCNKGTA